MEPGSVVRLSFAHFRRGYAQRQDVDRRRSKSSQKATMSGDSTIKCPLRGQTTSQREIVHLCRRAVSLRTCAKGIKISLE